MTTLNLTKKELKKLSTHVLLERLSGLSDARNKLFDYRHVFDFDNGEKIIDMIADEMNLINRILDERELDDI